MQISHFYDLFSTGSLEALQQALQQIEHAYAHNPHGFSHYHLWGKILSSLSQFLIDERAHLLEEAIDKFQLAHSSTPEPQMLLWDLAQAWHELSTLSNEISDLTQALNCFAKAHQMGPSLPFFYIDYGQALTSLAESSGDPKYLQQALELYKFPLAQQGDNPRALSKAWQCYAISYVKHFTFTLCKADLAQANLALEEAITAAPDRADLWLHWAEIFFHFGWYFRQVKALEVAIEKLTALKMSECNPLHVSALLGASLTAIGFLLEDAKLMQEGKQRVLAILSEDPKFLHALGSVHLITAIYFGDPKSFHLAVEAFKKGQHVEKWYGLFQAYFHWGLLTQEPALLEKSLEAIAHVVRLRPFAFFYFQQFGAALLALYHIKKELHFLKQAVQKLRHAVILCEEKESLLTYATALHLLGEHTRDEACYTEALATLKALATQFPAETKILKQLAYVLASFGKTHLESLYQALSIFEALAAQDEEDEHFWARYGYALLVLSQALHDENHPEKTEELQGQAEEYLMRALQLGAAVCNYHLACLYSLTNHLESSMHYLKRAEGCGCLPPTEVLEHEEWLQQVSGTETFREFLSTRKREYGHG